MTNYRYRHAMCNEAFQGWDFAEACRAIKRAGYDAIEIAPFTLAEDPATITAAQRREYRAIMAAEGLAFAGLHWLMVSPAGLHVTTPDKVLRERSWNHIRTLIDLCADLGENGVMVFGSPKQRGSTGGLSRADATRNWVEGLAAVSPQAAAWRVTVLVEALPANQCDVVQTLEEAVGVVKEIGATSIQTMFDTHNAVDEEEPHEVLVERYLGYIRHVHINEMDGRHPGRSNYDFKPLLRCLRRNNYQGWVSLEVFDFAPGAETIAHESLRYIENEIGKIIE
jgi:D-psicose/D-tagatose/L-ribulose 3-epimerase